MSFATDVARTHARLWVLVQVERILTPNGVVYQTSATAPAAVAGRRYIDTDDNHVWICRNGTTFADEGAPATDQIEYDVATAAYKYWSGSAWTAGKGFWYFSDRWLKSTQQWEGRVVDVSPVTRSIGDAENFMSRNRVSVSIADPDSEYIPQIEMWHAVGNSVTISIGAMGDTGSTGTRQVFSGTVDAVSVANRVITLTCSDTTLDWYDKEFGATDRVRMDQATFANVPGVYQSDVIGKQYPVRAGKSYAENWDGFPDPGLDSGFFDCPAFDADIDVRIPAITPDGTYLAFLVDTSGWTNVTWADQDVRILDSNGEWIGLNRGTGGILYEVRVNNDYPTTSGVSDVTLIYLTAARFATGYTLPLRVQCRIHSYYSATDEGPASRLDAVLQGFSAIQALDATSVTAFDAIIARMHRTAAAQAQAFIWNPPEGIQVRELIRRFCETYHAMVFINNQGGLEIAPREIARKQTTVTASTYTVLDTDEHIVCDTTSNTVTVYLTDSRAAIRRALIVERAGASNAVSVRPVYSGDYLDVGGSPSLTVSLTSDDRQIVAYTDGQYYSIPGYAAGVGDAGRIGRYMSATAADHVIDVTTALSIAVTNSRDTLLQEIQSRYGLTAGAGYIETRRNETQTAWVATNGRSVTVDHVFDSGDYDEGTGDDPIVVVSDENRLEYEQFGRETVAVTLPHCGYSIDIGDTVSVTTAEGHGAGGFDGELFRVIEVRYDLMRHRVSVKLER